MEVVQVLHMNKGEGVTSYAKNSAVQRKIISVANSVIKEAIEEFLSNNISQESIGIADLGCSSGPNTLLVISEIIDVIGATCQHMGRTQPELRVLLNDLFANDFNDIFQSLPMFYNKLKDEKGADLKDRCFISGVPGSFYGRLFAKNSLHFVHSSSSLHWLSQAPQSLQSNATSKSMNEGKLYISTTSPIGVVEAYIDQFQSDSLLFLKSRGEEIVAGGRMVLSFMGRRSSEPPTEESSCFQWELLAQALMSMASEGLIEEEKIDCFNAPYYAPSLEDLKRVVETEGSFTIDRFETFESDWSEVAREQLNRELDQTLSSGQCVAKFIRAVVESMLEFHFDRGIMDELFLRYGKIIDDHLSKNKTKFTSLVVSFTRKG